MIISIDRRLVIAASLIWETFTDKDAQDFYWEQTLTITARIAQAVSTVQTLIMFLYTLQSWLQRQDYEEVEQYQTALPAAPALKLLPMAQLAPEAGFHDSRVDGEPTVVLPFIVTSPPTPQQLLPPVKVEQVSPPKRKSKQSTTKRKTRTRTKAKAEAD